MTEIVPLRSTTNSSPVALSPKLLIRRPLPGPTSVIGVAGDDELALIAQISPLQKSAKT